MMEIRLKSTHLELLFVCLCLLTVLGPANGETVVKVKEGSEAVLPCLIKPRRDIRQKIFDWRKDGQKEVFFYEKGKHYNNGRHGQDEQFKGRVSHFPDQLQSGVASIRINNTKLSDSGNYTCDYSPDQPNRQTFYIELVVVACPKPHVMLLNQTKDLRLLQCEVRGVSANHKVELKDSDRNVLSAEETHTQTGGSYNIILNTTVTKTDNYHCVVTQEEICHQVSEKIFVHVSGACPKPSVTTLKQTKDWAILKCEVHDVSPKSEVKWQDSSGNNFTAEETLVTERGGSYDIILQTTVNKTDNYSCVVTQKEICHQTSEKISVYIHGPEPTTGPEPTKESSTGWIVAGVFAALFVVVALVMLFIMRHKIQRCIKGPQKATERDEKGDPSTSDKQELQPQSVSTDGDRDEQGESCELDRLEPEPQSV